VVLIGKDSAMKASIYAGLLATLLLAPAMVQAQRQPGPGTERTPPVKITKEQATKIALERIPGKATSVKIERKLGKNVYTVEIETANGEKDVFVDIESGEIVGTD
jgi:uncharacterized membrane protein YkoI